MSHDTAQGARQQAADRQPNRTTSIPPAAAVSLHRLYTTESGSGAYGGVARLQAAAARENLRLQPGQVAAFLHTEPTYGIHRQQRIRFPRRRVISFDIDWLWELDTAFMTKFARQNDGFAYLLVKIDVLSKQLAVEPMRTKNTGDTVLALEAICGRIGKMPTHIACDAGGEFLSEEFLAWTKARGIRVYFVTHSPHGAANVVSGCGEGLRLGGLGLWGLGLRA